MTDEEVREMGATPTPRPWAIWRVHASGFHGELAPWSGWDVCDSDGVAVARCYDEDSAQLIVTAVNAHDALVAVLRDLEWQAGEIGDPRCPSCQFTRTSGHARNCQLAAALSAVGGSPTEEQSGADTGEGQGG